MPTPPFDAAYILDEPSSTAAFAATWPAPINILSPEMPFILGDIYFGGRGRISGTVKVKGSPNFPVRRKVRLVREVDGVCIREVWSDAATGAYQFDFVDPRVRYTVITYDYENDFRAVIADNLQAEIIP